MNSLMKNGYQNIYLGGWGGEELPYGDILFSLCLFLQGGVLLRVYFSESVLGT